MSSGITACLYHINRKHLAYAQGLQWWIKEFIFYLFLNKVFSCALAKICMCVSVLEGGGRTRKKASKHWYESQGTKYVYLHFCTDAIFSRVNLSSSQENCLIFVVWITLSTSIIAVNPLWNQKCWIGNCICRMDYHREFYGEMPNKCSYNCCKPLLLIFVPLCESLISIKTVTTHSCCISNFLKKTPPNLSTWIQKERWFWTHLAIQGKVI